MDVERRVQTTHEIHRLPLPGSARQKHGFLKTATDPYLWNILLNNCFKWLYSSQLWEVLLFFFFKVSPYNQGNTEFIVDLTFMSKVRSWWFDKSSSIFLSILKFFLSKVASPTEAQWFHSQPPTLSPASLSLEACPASRRQGRQIHGCSSAPGHNHSTQPKSPIFFSCPKRCQI